MLTSKCVDNSSFGCGEWKALTSFCPYPLPRPPLPIPPSDPSPKSTDFLQTWQVHANYKTYSTGYKLTTVNPGNSNASTGYDNSYTALTLDHHLPAFLPVRRIFQSASTSFRSNFSLQPPADITNGGPFSSETAILLKTNSADHLEEYRWRIFQSADTTSVVAQISFHNHLPITNCGTFPSETGSLLKTNGDHLEDNQLSSKNGNQNIQSVRFWYWQKCKCTCSHHHVGSCNLCNSTNHVLPVSRSRGCGGEGGGTIIKYPVSKRLLARGGYGNVSKHSKLQTHAVKHIQGQNGMRFISKHKNYPGEERRHRKDEKLKKITKIKSAPDGANPSQ